MTNTETYEGRVAREVAASGIADIVRGETDFRPATITSVGRDATLDDAMILIRLPDGNYVAVADDDVTYVTDLNVVVIDLP